MPRDPVAPGSRREEFLEVDEQKRLKSRKRSHRGQNSGAQLRERGLHPRTFSRRSTRHANVGREQASVADVIVPRKYRTPGPLDPASLSSTAQGVSTLCVHCCIGSEPSPAPCCETRQEIVSSKQKQNTMKATIVANHFIFTLQTRFLRLSGQISNIFRRPPGGRIYSKSPNSTCDTLTQDEYKLFLSRTTEKVSRRSLPFNPLNKCNPSIFPKAH